MNQADLQALRNPLLVLFAVLLIAAAAVYSTEQLKVSAERQLAQQQARLNEARTRLQKSGDEKDIIVRYRDAFRALQRAGFVGEEKRINWLDGLRVTNQQADLFGIDYQIGSQKKYQYAASLNPGQIQLFESEMRLRFRLLHEEDIIRFFGLLARQNLGIFHVDQCEMRRIDTRGIIRFQPNVSADCEVSWITAKVKASGGSK
ncbi:MAG: hypothetical protein JSU71_07960 [Betaproteobacteria bacterium]|nr:MAG: hypothetical protein JSU71_07960 [Betaproteobacteria bacterium]